MVSTITFAPPVPTVPKARVSALFGGPSEEAPLLVPAAVEAPPEPEPVPEPRLDLEGGVTTHPERDEH
jgi:hypothetical protein